MDNHWTDACIICDAPLKSHEYAEHLKQCLLIETKRTGRTDAEVLSELRQLQAEAAGTATAAKPVPHSQRGGWADSMFGRQPTIPDGHTECLSCFGNKQLYPDCEKCDGKGWI